MAIRYSEVVIALWLALAAAPDAVALLEKVDAAEKQQDALRRSYVFRERQTNWDVDKNGQQGEKPDRVRVFEHIYLEGSLYRQLLEQNGRPLSASEIKKRDDARQKEAAKRRSRGKAGLLSRTRNIRAGAMGELAQLYRLTVVGEETLAGHLCWKVEAEPKGDVSTPRQKEANAYRQRLWIHQTEHVLVRRELDVIGPGAEIEPGGELRADFARQPETGVWFPTKQIIKFSAKFAGVARSRGLQEQEFYGHQRFQAESTLLTP